MEAIAKSLYVNERKSWSNEWAGKSQLSVWESAINAMCPVGMASVYM